MKQQLLSKVLFVLMTLLMVSTKMQAQEAEPYAVLSEDGLTVTFYYDTQKESRGGVNVTTYNGSYIKSLYNTATTAVFDVSFANYLPTSTAGWFSDCTKLTTITGVENIKTDNVTNMDRMFYYCSSLNSLDLSNFKTNNVTSMYQMFFYCYKLKNINISGFKTDKVTNMGQMFKYCSSLTDLDLSDFKTDNVTSMGQMFNYCSSLTSLDLSGFNTDNVTYMSEMFKYCSSLISLDLSNFKTDKVTYMDDMFNNCSKLYKIYVGNEWNTDNVTSGSYMFYNCKKLVGGKGTTYHTNNTDYTYARIDGGYAAPGYFTYKEASGINDIIVDIRENAPVYNLRGQRLTAPQRGINIIGGKKVVVK